MTTPTTTLALGTHAQAQPKVRTRRTMSATFTNLLVDLGIFAGFLLVSAPHFTGMTLHEWIGIAFGAAIIKHLLLHWQWLVAVTKRMFKRMPAATRMNYLLNTALFIDVTLVIFTGLLISKVALPFFGVTLNAGHAWQSIHTLSADISLWLIGLHVALHWKWIVKAATTYLLQPMARLLRGPRANQSITANKQEAAS